MSIEGVWTGEFHSPYGWENSGVYVISRGQIIGGNNRHYSIGTYSVEGNTYKSKVLVEYYHSPRTIFGENKDEFEIEVLGDVGNGVIHAQVVQPDKPEFSVSYCLRKRADLPAAWT